MTTTKPDGLVPLAAAGEIGRALSAAGCRFVHWKSNGHLAEALSGRTDIDMFADPGQRDAVRACLRAQQCLEVMSQPWASYPDVEDWLAVDAQTGRFLHLHLHFALVTGLRRIKHLRLPWDTALLANTDHGLDAVWPTPTADMELIILLVRMWAKMPPSKRIFSPRLPRHVRQELDWLISRAQPAEMERLAAALLPGIDSAAVAALISDPPPSDAAVLSVSRSLYGALKGKGASRMPWPLALVRASWLNLRAAAAKQLRKLRPATVTGKRVAGKGLVVAFIGSDGSGKSTLTREMRTWLRYKLDAHGYYMGSGQGSTRLLDRLRHAVKAKTKKAKPAKALRGDGEARRKVPGFIGRVLALHQLSAIRAKLRALREAHRLANGGSIIVLDRFPQFQFPGIYDGPRLQDGNSFAWAARAEMAAFRAAAELAPDLVIKLMVTPEVGYARKPDHNFETLKRKAEITGLLTFPRSQVIEIDATQPLDEVILQAKNGVWCTMLAKAMEGRHG